MEKSKTISILKFFYDIDNQVAFNNKTIKEIEERYYTPSFSGDMDGMPKSKGVTSSPTETTVFNIPLSASQTRRELELKNKRLCSLKKAILREMDCLTFSQKYIVDKFYIEKFQWVQISKRVHYSVRQCKNIRNRALEKLGKRFDANKTIINFNFPQ